MGPPTKLEPNSLVGEDFKIERRLGEGGMGVVYAARQLTTGHERAVKVMHSPFALDLRSRERFEQEARIGARILSDHVVQVIAAGVDEQTHTPWIAMELLAGQDLERHIQTRGPLPLADAALVSGQVIHAVAAAHDVDVVHRDIKPENIFLSVSRVVGVPFMVKILDFGIAKLRSSARAATVAVGTPGYMAPEQSQSSEDLGPPADVWSLGLVVFRMLTGSPFWRAAAEGMDMPRLWREMLIDPIPRATERAAEYGAEQRLPPGFDEWFAACVEREPSLRFQHARAAGLALDEVFRAAGVTNLPSLSPNTAGPGLSAAIHEVHNAHAAAPGGTLFMSRTFGPDATSAQLTPAQLTSTQTTAREPNFSLTTHRVSFREPGERLVALANEGDNLLEVSLAAGVPHYHACGGKAQCSTCRVVVLQGSAALGPRTEAEAKVAQRRKWPKTTRLACQARIYGPCTVKRLVVDPNDATMADIRRTTEGGAARSQPATALVLRLEGIDEVLAHGFPDDAIHVLERCLAPLEELLEDNGGRMAGFDGATAIAAFAPGADGVRRALRVALRASARIRRLNPYLLKHFGAQVSTAAGLGGGILLEGKATTNSHTGQVLMGAAIREARRACGFATPGQVMAPSALLEGLELICTEGPEQLSIIHDFAKSDVVYLVQTSFDRIEGRALAFAEAFYADLFERHPDSIALFEHSDMQRQHKMLTDTLALAVRGLDNFAKIEDAVRELGERHVDYGATLRDYKFVGQALLATLERFLGDAFTPEAELAWREVYSTLVRTMTMTPTMTPPPTTPPTTTTTPTPTTTTTG
ncbi:Serine/threonine-protein kinase Pkn1 [Enhygromyxa salina]|uniref:Serine/threonine-protein kinase Pkn1 n=1 Tax=Enhygromyxa salina TaxID=215803 RepID=A0A2S9XXC9_9BACT|nr:protein kinase [Enhygromyxa salina]PRP97537.1 Serine/threonine-protein kinase Pkn1 [Enhygromyxa salina]